MPTRAISVAVLLVLWATLTATAQSCESPEFMAALAKVKTQQEQLLAYKLHDETDEEVTPPLQTQIRNFKDALAKLGDVAASCVSPGDDAEEMENNLAVALEANKPATQEVYDDKKSQQLDHIYGDSIRVKVTEPAQPSHLLLIEFGFGIACGDDSVLLAYEGGNGRWQRTLRWESGDYDEVKDAFGDFFTYVPVPQSGRRGWLLAAAHGSPWCTSRWSGFGLDVIQPATAQAPQKVLQHIVHGYVRGDVEPSLKLVPGGFQLKVETGMIDGDIMTRIGIYRYRVNGDQFERVQPIANNGRDFVDEWLQAPWTDAARWSSAKALDALQEVHTRFGDKTFSEKSPAYTFGPVRGCSDSAARFQVELNAEWLGDKGSSKPAPTTYFLIEQGMNSFTMLSASSDPYAQCKGADIMKAR